jgi:hypothetical protein
MTSPSPSQPQGLDALGLRQANVSGQAEHPEGNWTESHASAIELLRSIETPCGPRLDARRPGNSEGALLYDLAIKNKISLLYLESLRQCSELGGLWRQYQEERDRRDTFVTELLRVAGILEDAGIDYAFYKTIRPYPAVPGDIDALVLGDDSQYRRALERLVAAGYRQVVPDGPTAATGDLVDLDAMIPVDLEREVGISYIVYMNKNHFGDDIVRSQVEGRGEVNALSVELDLATVITHSVMEQLYLLGEHYTLVYRLSALDLERFVAILRQHKIVSAGRAFVTIAACLCEEANDYLPEKLSALIGEVGFDRLEAMRLARSGFEMPHRYSMATVAKFLREKLHEARFRRSFCSQLLHMLDPRVGKFVLAEVVERRRRGYYIKDYVAKPPRYDH